MVLKLSKKKNCLEILLFSKGDEGCQGQREDGAEILNGHNVVLGK